MACPHDNYAPCPFCPPTPDREPVSVMEVSDMECKPMDAFEAGFTAGFMASSDGWNGQIVRRDSVSLGPPEHDLVARAFEQWRREREGVLSETVGTASQVLTLLATRGLLKPIRNQGFDELGTKASFTTTPLRSMLQSFANLAADDNPTRWLVRETLDTIDVLLVDPDKVFAAVREEALEGDRRKKEAAEEVAEERRLENHRMVPGSWF